MNQIFKAKIMKGSDVKVDFHKRTKFLKSGSLLFHLVHKYD